MLLALFYGMCVATLIERFDRRWRTENVSALVVAGWLLLALVVLPFAGVFLLAPYVFAAVVVLVLSRRPILGRWWRSPHVDTVGHVVIIILGLTGAIFSAAAAYAILA